MSKTLHTLSIPDPPLRKDVTTTSHTCSHHVYPCLYAFTLFSRALRPLRVATRMDGIRVVVMAMAESIPAIGEVLLVGALFYYIFSVLGVNLMSGLFLGCYSSGNILDPYYLVADGESINKTW